VGLYFAQMGDNYSALRRNPAGDQRHARIILCLGSKISIFAFGLALEERGSVPEATVWSQNWIRRGVFGVKDGDVLF
jgi:hypothetical protein